MDNDDACFAQFSGETYGPAPLFDVDGPRVSALGCNPRWASMALQGHGVFRAWKAANQISDAFTAVLLGYDRQYRWPFLRLAGATGWPQSQARWVGIARALPLYPVFVLEHIANGDLVAAVTVRYRPCDVIRWTTLLPQSVFRRVRPRDCSALTIQALEQHWPGLRPVIRRTLTCGLKCITWDTILCLDLPPDVCTPSVLHATQASEVSEIYCAVSEIMQLTGGEWRYGQVSDAETILGKYWDLVAKAEQTPIPEPPYDPPFGMVALTTEDAIGAEAEELNTCLLSYLPTIRSGRRYAYAIHVPERATLVLVRDFQDPLKWSVEALVGPGNGPVLASTSDHVQTWLRQAGGEP